MKKNVFAEILSGSEQIIMIILILIIGIGYIVNGDIPESLVEFAKWMIGGASATSVAYIIKSGIETKASGGGGV
jgi:hypothetical protein